MIEKETFFDHCRVISLRRRKDRREAFEKRAREVFKNSTVPFAIRWFWGFEGKLLPKPAGHFPPNGAFGCAFSHVVAWAEVIAKEESIDPDAPLVFFEDDAYFCDCFPEKLEAVLKNVPDDWDIFYLGGEILSGRPSPKEVAPGVARVQNVNRLHAYAVKTRALNVIFPRLLAYLTTAPERKGPSGDETCFDYEVGRICEEGELIAYCSKPWLVGQAGFGSDTYEQSDAISRRTRFWQY